MNSCHLILLFGTCLPHWTTATPVPNVSYDLSNGILNNVVAANARSINLSYLNIEYIAANSLDALDEVETLDLSNNDLVDLPPFVFTNLVNLKELSLFNNSISSFNKTFVGLINLERLNVAQNPIKFLRKGDLFGLPKSVQVVIQSTEYITISSGIFKEPSDSSVSPKNNETALMEDENTQHDYTYHITDLGILDFIESSRLDLLYIEDVNHDIGTKPVIDLSGKGISGFENEWFQVNDSYYNEIDLCANDIHELSPELLNNLSPAIKRINLGYNHIPALKKNDRIDNTTIELDLTANDLSTIEAGAFGKLNLLGLYLERNLFNSTAFARLLPTTIRILKLDENHISEIPLESFYGLKNLEHLSMMYNQVKNIEPGTFRDQKNLKIIELMSNDISELKPGFFQGLDGLERIDLGGNHIKYIPSNMFEGFKPNPTKLTLQLGGNYIKNIEDGAFSHMNLMDLQLSGDELNDDSIGERTFNGSDIQSIHLASEHFTKFNGEWFKGVSGLTSIDLHSNLVKRIENGFAKHMKNVRNLLLGVEELRLENGALFGLSTEEEVAISAYPKTFIVIEGGFLEDLRSNGNY